MRDVTGTFARCSALTAFVILTAAVSGVASQPVEIQLRGHYFAEPATVRVTVAVEPDAANRLLRLEANGDALFRSSEVTLEGDTERRFHTIEFKNLPAGQYTLRAELLSGTAVRGTATHELLVTGGR